MVLRALAALIVALGLSTAQARPPPEWPFQGWQEAVGRARAEGKPLFVMFGYEDCRWCEHLYRRGMNDAAARSRYAQHAVLTYVDTKAPPPEAEFVLPGGDRLTRAELIKRFRAYPTPSWVFLAADGSVLHANRNGKATARDMVLDLELALGAQ